MYCLICGRFSFSHICKGCQETFLKPYVTKRVLSNSLEVYSFYKYSHIEDLVLTKHKDIGYFIYNILAKNSFGKFAFDFKFDKEVYSLSIDDTPKSGYSHTAILNKHLSSRYIKPLFSKLRAKNQVSYSGKTLEFRVSNPRDFKYDFRSDVDIILVDDIVTTGTTLQEAQKKVQNSGATVLFALTLCDARDN